MKQWEILKGLPAGWQREHWFVILSSDERCREPRLLQVNGLPCFTLRGSPGPRDIVLDSADGLQAPTSVPCDFIHTLDKAKLHSSLGSVSWERQQQIREKIKRMFGF
jgi:hypothetical protein